MILNQIDETLHCIAANQFIKQSHQKQYKLQMIIVMQNKTKQNRTK